MERSFFIIFSSKCFSCSLQQTCENYFQIPFHIFTKMRKTWLLRLWIILRLWIMLRLWILWTHSLVISFYILCLNLTKNMNIHTIPSSHKSSDLCHWFKIRKYTIGALTWVFMAEKYHGRCILHESSQP